ncbi:MAG: hypothetical protein MK411_12275, partial [SAR202 cluster bacterium]|nr:hypothetical protein [SAR202 cluster bacterium]
EMMAQAFAPKPIPAPAMRSPPEKWRGLVTHSIASVSNLQKPSCLSGPSPVCRCTVSVGDYIEKV